jgi:hypothetical protein
MPGREAGAGWRVLTKYGKGKDMHTKTLLFAVGLMLLQAGCGGRAGSNGSSAADAVTTGVVVEGLRFGITARPVRSLSGWAVRLEVQASSDDGMDHWIEKNPFVFKGSYTHNKVRHGFETGGPMEIPPDRMQIKPGDETAFSSTLPLDAENHPVENGESMEFSIRISGMVSSGGDIIKPELAQVKLKVSRKGTPRLSIKPAKVK